jgi:tRNA1Val (adenine37-N6)-methyltransferase
MNTWFQFKQFTIHQEKSAMKVCTDACLFGAWVAKKLEDNKIITENVLDIGCGTGLITLMIAQKSSAQIDSVEIDKDAFEQAKENIHLSNWNERINIHHNSVTNFKSSKKYELIICNPPFYENQLKSDNDERNMAMHATTLSHLELAIAIKNNLAENGFAAILLPCSSVKKMKEMLLTQKLFIDEKLDVAHSPNHPLFRSMLLISGIKKELSEYSVAIKNTDREYSKEFTELLKDYYLNF